MWLQDSKFKCIPRVECLAYLQGLAIARKQFCQIVKARLQFYTVINAIKLAVTNSLITDFCFITKLGVNKFQICIMPMHMKRIILLMCQMAKKLFRTLRKGFNKYSITTIIHLYHVYWQIYCAGSYALDFGNLLEVNRMHKYIFYNKNRPKNLIWY